VAVHALLASCHRLHVRRFLGVVGGECAQLKPSMIISVFGVFVGGGCAPLTPRGWSKVVLTAGPLDVLFWIASAVSTPGHK